MKYVYARHPGKISTLAVTLAGGRRAENNVPHGMAHFMEHFRFKGTQKYSCKELTRAVAFNGGSWNAFTDEDLVSYYISIPNDKLEQACDYLSQVVLYPTFPDDELEKEKEVVCQEIRNYEDDIDDLVYNRMLSKVFSNSLSKNIAGTENSVKSITQNDLILFDNDVYSPDNMLITLSSVQDRPDLIEKYFGHTNNILNILPPDTDPYYAKSFENVVYKDGLVQETILIGFGGPNMYDLKQRAVCDVFNSIFGGDDDARLFDRIRDDMGLVYGIYSYFRYFYDGNLFTISSQTDPENTELLLETIDEEIGKMVTTLPTEEELQRAKNRIRSRKYRKIERSGGVCFDSVYNQFYNLKPMDEHLEEIDRVTAKDVKSFAEKVFGANKYTVIGME